MDMRGWRRDHRLATGLAATAFLATLGLVWSTPVAARADIATSALRACRQLQDRTERYRCYDALEQAGQSPEPTAAPDPTADNDSGARHDFGKPASERQAKQPDHITLRVVSARKNLSGSYIFLTDDGQLWRQTGSARVQFRDRPFQAEIRKAALGSFFLSPEGRRARVRVKRIK